MHEVLVNRLGGLSLPRKSVVRLTDRPDMTLDVYRGRKTTMQQQQQKLPAETTVHEKWLPAETVRVILLPAETLGRKLNHKDSLCRKLLTKHNSLGTK